MRRIVDRTSNLIEPRRVVESLGGTSRRLSDDERLERRRAYVRSSRANARDVGRPTNDAIARAVLWSLLVSVQTAEDRPPHVARAVRWLVDAGYSEPEILDQIANLRAWLRRHKPDLWPTAG